MHKWSKGVILCAFYQKTGQILQERLWKRIDSGFSLLLFFCSFTSVGVNFWMVGCLEFWCCFGVVFFSLVTLLPVLLNNRVSVCTVAH